MNPLTGKNRLLRTLQHQAVDEVPWVPYAGVHAGKLTGFSAIEVLTEKDKLLQSLLRVNEVYHPDGQPVVFDLQLEAEIYGCKLMWAADSPPSVATHPLAETDQIPDWLPTPDSGRLPLVLDTMREMKARVGDQTALLGLVTGPLTLASHLRGTELFLDLVYNPDYVKRLIEHCRAVAEQIADFYLDAGMDIIALVDPLVSQVSPRNFSQYLAEPYTQLFSHIRAQNAHSALFVCGDATKSLEVMCKTTPDILAVDENIDMLQAKPITDRYNVVLAGNIPLTTRMLLGSQMDNMQFVVDFLDQLDHRNLILSPGCDMPYDTPIDNVIGCLQAVRNPHEARHLLASYQAEQPDLESVTLPDYPNLSRPLVEVFTLDSAACPACGYMLAAAQDAVGSMSEVVDLVEYKFTRKENVARAMKMGIHNLPVIFINGELKFSSLIPERELLVNEIRKAYREPPQ